MLSLGVVGCSTGGGAGATGAPTGEPTLEPVSHVTQTSQVVRPIDDYLPAPDVALKTVAAYTAKVNSCLASRGLEPSYVQSDDPSQISTFIAGLAADNVVRSDLWGFFDTSSATYSRYGYGRPPSSVGVVTATPPKGARSVVDKCTAAAAAALPDGAKSSPMFLVDIHVLPGRGPEVPLNDSRWLAAQAKWASCMKTAGFDYRTPLDAIGDPKWVSRPAASGGASAPDASAEQIATASADIACKQKTNLVGIGLAVQGAYDQQYIQKNTAALAGFRAKIAAYLAAE